MTLAHIEPRAAEIEHYSAGGFISLRSELDLWQECFEFAKAIASTPFVPEPIRNNPPAVMATILRGHELGVSAMHALQQIDFIKGRPALRSELMRALVQAHGHEIWTEEFTTTRVVLCGNRQGGQHVQKVGWTMDDAKRAGLSGKENWRNYPRAMLLARATGELCRLMFADVLAGMSYTLEELQDLDVEELEPAAPADETRPAGQTRKATAPTAKKRAPARRKAAPARSTPPEPPLPGEDGYETPPASAVPQETSEPDVVVNQRAQGIAIRAREAGVDHHHVVAAVTHGRATSAKDITGPEADQVLDALAAIRDGRARLEQTGDGWQLVAIEPGDTDGTDPWEWTVAQWEAFAAVRSIKPNRLLIKANEVAKQLGEGPVTDLAALAGRDAVCETLRNAIEGGS